MDHKKRGLLYLLFGTLIFIIGLTLIYEDYVTIGVVVSGLASIITFTGFSTILNKDPEEKSKAEKKKQEAKAIAYINSVIISTIASIDNAFSTNSQYINKRATAKLDYSIYIFVQFYYKLCASKNAYLLEAFIALVEQKLKFTYSSMMDIPKINRILDERINKYDLILQTHSGAAKDELLYVTIVDYIAEDLYLSSERKGDIFYEILELDNVMILKEEDSYKNLTNIMSNCNEQIYS